jgi:Protein of unknown function (DUF3422)
MRRMASLYSISSVEKHGSNFFSPVARRCGGIPPPLASSVFIMEKPCQGVDGVAEDQNSKTPAFAPGKLRHAIKGISIAAITYYPLSILRLIFEGLHRKIDAFDTVVAKALSLPFVLALILWMFRRRGKPVPEVR